jgi:PucR-like helix-turn-helix protein/diguanylate cyclase with GGDEF domain
VAGACADTDLAGRLRGRREELEQTALATACSIADPVEVSDPRYAEGLRSAVSSAVEYGLALFESADEPPPVPASLIGQSRLAARSGVGLDTVLRRYLSGCAFFGDVLVEEAEGDGIVAAAEIKRLLRAQAAFFDRLVVAVCEEYALEAQSRRRTLKRRRADTVRRLLDGELVDTRGLNYEFGGAHLGLVAIGQGAEDAIRSLARRLDRSLLLIVGEDTTVSAWLGGRRPLSVDRVVEAIERAGAIAPTMALGEPGSGLAGWRLTHRQAMAVLPFALRNEGRCVRYAEAGLLASTVNDHLLATSLRRLYLDPLDGGPNGARNALIDTLRAYFAAERNVSATAAALGLTRQAVSARLATIEQKIGHQVARRAAELEVAVRIHDLEAGKSQ